MPQLHEISFTQLGFEPQVDWESCTNVGPCCYTCPQFDVCDHHFDSDDVVNE